MTAPVEPHEGAIGGNSRPVLVMEPGLMPLLAGVGPPYGVTGPVDWMEVDAILRRAPATAVVVVDPYAGPRQGERFPRVRHLLRRFPSVPVVAVMELRPEVVGDVDTLMSWGISEIVAQGHEATPAALEARLRMAHARPLKRRMEAGLSPYASPEARTILRASAEVVVEGGQAPELAARLGVGARTLTARCRSAGVPAPRHLLAWMRLLLACLLLDDPGRTVQSAALGAGYSTDKSLRRSLTGLLRTSTTALRRHGALAGALPAFDAALRDAREAARGSPRSAAPPRADAE